ncbi:fructosamine kinase family protein [Asaia spathodeae]|uniref:fructosamine kinase family protein n=1 Tax=Asaia spathodeae TaxID=657016 RepID=UPI002FC35739
MPTRLESAALLIGESFSFDAAPMGGGDLSEIWHLRFESGREAVVKFDGQAAAEAAMLRAIAATGAPVPEILAAQGDLLVLSFIRAARLSESGWAALGKTLSTLHAANQPPRYGWSEDYAFGSMPIANAWTSDWRNFWRDYRLEPCLSFLPRETAARVSHIGRTLERFLPEAPRPSLLHGDLWGGNFILTRTERAETKAVLIDPASLIGDASADFAMLTLFSAPPEIFWRSYGPLPDGYDRSIDVYRLWPALVHYRLFGQTYLGMVESLLDRLEV